MVDFKKVDELREQEAQIRKGLLAKFRSIDGAVWAGIVAGLVVLAVIIIAVVAKH